MLQVTSAKSIDILVKNDLRLHKHFAQTDAFLNAIFPLQNRDTLVKDIHNKLKKYFYSVERERWTRFPWSGKQARSQCKPFVDTANAIVQKLSQNQFAGQSERVAARWMDMSNIFPASTKKELSLFRPDMALVLKDVKGMDMSQLSDVLKKADKMDDAMVEKSEVWWRRMVVPVEVKSGDSEEDMYDAVQRLCGYMRQVLGKQLDRRFVLGLTLCGEWLAVWLCDRSGLLGTWEAINIHAEPERFIHVIAGLALMEPHRLGWDPTMKLYLEHPSVRTVHSYDPSVTIDDYLSSGYKTDWAIECRGEDGETNETYVTRGAIRVALSEVMCGRSTVVWRARRLRGEKLGEERYVLKQSWRPLSEHSKREAEMYPADLNSKHVGEICYGEDVEIDGEADTTKRIRSGLTVVEEDQFWERRGKTFVRRTPNIDVYYYHGASKFIEVHKFGFCGQVTPEPRVLCRQVMKTYGWPIKYFKDIHELLRVMRDAIQGHRDLFYRGVLQRDISTGNILICPDGDDVESTHGCIIDLDNAKKGIVVANVPKLSGDGDHEEWPKDFRKLHIRLADTLEWLLPEGIEEAGFVAALRRVNGDIDYVSPYIKAVLQAKAVDKTRPLSHADLDLLPEPENYPDFSQHIPQDALRRGTLPFMSYEILTNSAYVTNTSSDILHQDVHDMESFMWVLIYICVTRCGPTGLRAKDKDETPSASEKTDMVWSVVDKYFDGNRQLVVKSKMNLFHRPELMTDEIFPAFHEYFDSLKGLVLEWWRLLRLAYTFRGCRYIHDQFLKAINKAIEDIEAEGSQDLSSHIYSHAAAFEVDRRRKDLFSFLIYIKEDLADDSPSRETPAAVKSASLTRKLSSSDLVSKERKKRKIA